VVSLPLVLLAVYRQWSRGRRPARQGEVVELVTPEVQRYRRGLLAFAVADVLVAACWALELISPALPGGGPPPRLGVELVSKEAHPGAPAVTSPRRIARPPRGALPAHGAVIARVLPGSPAERGGLKKGDEILRIDGVPTPDDAAVAAQLAQEAAGTPRIIEYRRAGMYRGTSVIPEASVPDEGEPDGEEGPPPGGSPGEPPGAGGPKDGASARATGRPARPEPPLFAPEGPATPPWPGRRTLTVVGLELVLCAALWLWARRRGVPAGRALLGAAGASVGGLFGHVLVVMLVARIVGGASAGGALLGLLGQVVFSLLAAVLGGGLTLLPRTLQAIAPPRAPAEPAAGEPPVGTPTPPLGRASAVGLGLLLLLGGAVRLVMLIATLERLTGIRLGEVQVTEAFGSATRGHAAAITLLAFTVALLGPLGEELVFRGLILPVLLRLRGPVLGVLLSAAAFSLAHAATYGLGMVQVLWAGVALGWTALAGRSLLCSVLTHALYNAVLMALYFLFQG
jgi:membrane protease YdiL (CAAX protease family)